MNLYRKGDFVSQATKEQCVSAAMQIMLNVIGADGRPVERRRRRRSRTLAKVAVGCPQRRNRAARLGARPREARRRKYEVVVAPTRGKAIERAVAGDPGDRADRSACSSGAAPTRGSSTASRRPPIRPATGP